MKKNFLKSFFTFLVTSVAFSSSAMANNLILTTTDSETKASKGQLVSFDLNVTSNVAGFEFKIRLPENLSKKQINLKSCLSDLPNGFISMCDFYGKDLKVAVIAPAAKPTEKGNLSIGRIYLPFQQGKVEIYDLQVFDELGKEVTSKTIQ